MRIRISLLLVAFQGCAGFASAAPIHLTFKAIAAEVSLSGSPPVKTDLSVSLLADTAGIMRGGGYGQSDRYLNLTGYFTSKGLGLSNVEGSTPLAVHIGAPAAAAPFGNSTVLLVSGDVVNGIFNLPGLGTWDRRSAIGPLRGSATASGPLRVTLENGSTLSIATLESAPPYGNVAFEATIAPESVQGSLHKLGAKDLYLRTSGTTVVRFRLLANTGFRNRQGSPIRDSLLKPGDQLSVFVNPDDPETAVSVVLVRNRDRKGR
jgi:hypothetical protein